MELLILVAVLLVIDIAALRWGADSRDWSTDRSDRPARSI
jgi:hypothetical protein